MMDEFCIVYELPENLNSIPFMNVDWFNCADIISDGNLIQFVKDKRYYNRTKDYIILRGNDKVLRIPKEVSE